MKNFDFNAIEQVTMGVTLPNKEKTRLHLTTPTVSLVEKLEANIGKVDEILNSDDKVSINNLFQMLADLMSCNKEFRTVTVAELKDCLLAQHVNAFLIAYTEFLAEIKSAKN
ncbi:MAG: hypothetical protein K2J71_04500 [Oscillospiraceae bacterium]|nr:hypothetical protein [Oscillospiraceae bacterium]